jgi:hypothetical protein
LLLLGSIRCTKIYIYFFVFFILSFQSFFLFYSRMRIAEACGVLAKQRNPNPDIEMLKHLRRHGATRCFIFLFSFFVFFSLRRTSWATEWEREKGRPAGQDFVFICKIAFRLSRKREREKNARVNWLNAKLFFFSCMPNRIIIRTFPSTIQ